MILIAFSLLDNKTGAYSTPFFFNHRGHAIRAVQEIGADTKTTVGRHPHDYTLCDIGSFDDQTGYLRTMEVIPLGTVASFVVPQANQMPLFQAAESAINPMENGHAA